MIINNESTCPKCAGHLKPIGKVKRIIRTKGGDKHWIKIRLLVCIKCGKTHRELPNYLFPYKHYEASIIEGVLDGTITYYDLDYEDYPCEITMKRWIDARNKHLL